MDFTTDRPFTRRTAAEQGIRRPAFERLLIAGSIRRVVRGVYVDTDVPDSRELRIAALKQLAPPEAVICNESAAWVYGVNTFKPSEQHRLVPSFVVPHSTTRITRPGVSCRQAKIPLQDVDVIDGIRITTPLRTTSDLLRRLYRPYALAAADGMARAGMVDVGELISFVARLKGYPGIVQARSLSVLVEERSQSPGESWMRLRVHDAGFPPPKPQVRVIDHAGTSFYLDLAYPEILVGVEYDGREFHSSDDHREHDRRRREHLCDTLGWRWVVARRESIFGLDTSFENELGALLGVPPLLPRRWGHGDAKTLVHHSLAGGA